MIRKLIKHGESSLTVSLPRSFVKENHLNKGQEIEVREIDNGLFISTGVNKELRSLIVDVSDQLVVIRKILGAAYKCGYNEVNIQFSSFDELKEIKDVLQRQFMGYEIIKQGKGNILIKKISEDNFEQFNNVIRRFFLVVNSMASDFMEAVKKDDLEWLRTISLVKYESDKLADYCRRAINLKFKSDYKRLAPLYVIVEQVEKLSDNYRELCECISSGKIRLNDETKKLVKCVVNFQEFFSAMFFDFELREISGFKKAKDALQSRLYLYIKKIQGQDSQVIIILDRMLNIISSLNGPLMAVYV